MRFKYFIISIILFATMLLSCGNEVIDPNGRDKGSLMLNFGYNTLSKTIVPNADMNIVSYDIQGNGPSGSTISLQDITQSSVAINDLIVGSWTLVVYGKNAAGTTIGSGSSTAVIVNNQSTAVSITIVPLDGNGTLGITLSWDNEIPDPRMTAILTKIGESPVEFTNFTYSSNSFSYIDSAIAPGYYTLQMQLKSGTNFVWGAAPVVRIISGFTTPVDLSAGTITNGLHINISNDLQNPLNVYLIGGQTSLPYGTDMNLTAVPAESVDSYAWYLNGTFLTGQNGNSLTIGSALSPGVHRIDVIVTKGLVLSSTNIVFTVLDPGSSSSSASSSSAPSTGTFGVYSETIPMDVQYGTDAEIVPVQGLYGCDIYPNDTLNPGEGIRSIRIVGTNLGVGFYIRRRPLGSTIDFTDIEFIHFMYKGNNGFQVSMVDQFVRTISVDDLPSYGAVFDGTWCNIKIPISAFPGLDVSKVESYIYIDATPVHGHSPGDSFNIDNIYFSGTNYVGNTNTPLSNSPEQFGLYSESTALDIEWNIDAKLTPFVGMQNYKVTTNPAEGDECWQFEGTDTWMGFAFEVMPFTDANAKDLSAYNYLNFKYRGTKNFQLGMRWVGGNVYISVADMLGFGLVLDGNWCSVKIPLSSFPGLDKSQVLQYLMFSSVGGDYVIGDLHYFDDVYFSLN